jgi:hypothetical protein
LPKAAVVADQGAALQGGAAAEVRGVVVLADPQPARPVAQTALPRARKAVRALRQLQAPRPTAQTTLVVRFPVFPLPQPLTQRPQAGHRASIQETRRMRRVEVTRQIDPYPALVILKT